MLDQPPASGIVLKLTCRARPEEQMHHAKTALLFGVLALVASSVLAQTTAPVEPSPAPSAVGDIPNWSWIVLAAILVAAVLWYVAKGRRKP